MTDAQVGMLLIGLLVGAFAVTIALVEKPKIWKQLLWAGIIWAIVWAGPPLSILYIKGIAG